MLRFGRVGFLPACAAAGILCGCGGPSAQAPLSAPQRIVCGSPAVTEIVFALGCGDRVVGVSDYASYPPQAREKALIGGWINPNRERLLVLKPDIIITQGKHEALAAFAAEYGVRFHAVELNTMQDIYAAISSIAGMLDVAERGADLAGLVRNDIASVRGQVGEVQPRRVLLIVGRLPGSLAGAATAGSGTFLDEIVTIAGGTNIFSDAAGGYATVSKESLLVRNPEVILEVNPDGLNRDAMDRLRADWRELPSIPAVRNGRIHCLTNDFLLLPGPRAGQTAMRFAGAIHPELFVE